MSLTDELVPRRRDGRPVLMGVVNVTPDSFSDGGRWFDPHAAVEHGLQLLEQGADVLDVGGESTRPGAGRPDADEELRRVLPVVLELARAGAYISVDTMRSEVAARAVDAGARMVNDVSGGLADPAMARVVAALGAPFVLMHWRGHSHDMQTRTQYDDLLGDVCAELTQQLQRVVDDGLPAERVVLDPGFGFAKTAEQNWQLMAGLETFTVLGSPVLVGTSRKSFLGRVGASGEEPVPASERDAATAATSVLAAQAGVWGVRVHDVPSSLAALEVARRVENAR